MIEFAFLHNRSKWAGVALILAGLTLAVLVQPNYDSVKDGSGLLVQVFLLLGLLVIICSRQKTEDEYINHVRLIAMQWALIALIILRLSWKTIGYFTADESWMPQWHINSLLEIYLLLFYYQVWLKERLSNLLKQPNGEKHN